MLRDGDVQGEHRALYVRNRLTAHPAGASRRVRSCGRRCRDGGFGTAVLASAGPVSTCPTRTDSAATSGRCRAPARRASHIRSTWASHTGDTSPHGTWADAIPVALSSVRSSIQRDLGRVQATCPQVRAPGPCGELASDRLSPVTSSSLRARTASSSSRTDRFSHAPSRVEGCQRRRSSVRRSRPSSTRAGRGRRSRCSAASGRVSRLTSTLNWTGSASGHDGPDRGPRWGACGRWMPTRLRTLARSAR